MSTQNSTKTDLTVLMVDDETIPANLYVKALKRHGFHVEQCLNPDSALSFVKDKAQDVDGIVLDIMMPPGQYGEQRTREGLTTGVSLCKDLQRERPQTPILVVTNTADKDILGEFLEGPLLKVVQKVDCRPRELAELLKEMIDTASAAPST